MLFSLSKSKDDPFILPVNVIIDFTDINSALPCPLTYQSQRENPRRPCSWKYESKVPRWVIDLPILSKMAMLLLFNWIFSKDLFYQVTFKGIKNQIRVIEKM